MLFAFHMSLTVKSPGIQPGIQLNISQRVALGRKTFDIFYYKGVTMDEMGSLALCPFWWKLSNPADFKVLLLGSLDQVGVLDLSEMSLDQIYWWLCDIYQKVFQLAFRKMELRHWWKKWLEVGPMFSHKDGLKHLVKNCFILPLLTRKCPSCPFIVLWSTVK